MELKKAIEIVETAVSEVTAHQTELKQKLEKNNTEKARAEEAKLRALESQDEASYKAACRAIAEADAGIEFCTICLKQIRSQPGRTPEADRDIQASLNDGARQLFAAAMHNIASSYKQILDVADAAIASMQPIETARESWNNKIMNREVAIHVTAEKISLSQIRAKAQASLEQIKEMMNRR